MITNAERAWLYRNSLGQDINTFATKQGTKVWVIKGIESGRIQEGKVFDRIMSKAPVDQGLIEDLLRILRRREASRGKSLRDVAGEFGVSHVTYLRMEDEADERLVDWWRQRGDDGLLSAKTALA